MTTAKRTATSLLSQRSWRRLTSVRLATSLVTSLITSLTLVSGGTLGAWLAIEAVVPRLAQADSHRVAVVLEREVGESYDTLIRRAEAAARVVAQRSFGRDRGLTDVAVTIMGQSGGAIAPLLSLEVNRTQWNSRPEPRRWATYYLTARALLQLDGTVPVSPPTTTALPPAPAPMPGQMPGQIPAIAVPASPPTAAPVAQPTQSPAATSPAVGPTVNTPASDNPVRINLPAAPAGQLGLPRSILR